MSGIIGLIFLLIGGGLAFYGYSENNSLEAQVSSLFGQGSLNPGTPFISFGVILVIVGAILLLAWFLKRKQ